MAVIVEVCCKVADINRQRSLPWSVVSIVRLLRLGKGQWQVIEKVFFDVSGGYREAEVLVVRSLL